MRNSLFRLPGLTMLVSLLCLSISCNSAPEKKYIPAADLAHSALSEALEQWKSGAKHGTIDSFSVPIEVFDARWQNGKKLESFEILSEVESNGPKIFIVKMKLDDDTEEKEQKYLVLGKNPLLIFREQDYQKASGTGG